MKTTIKYNLTPPDGKYDTAEPDVEKIVKDYVAKKLPVDELIVEVNDVFCTKCKKNHAVMNSCNGIGSNNVIQISGDNHG